MGHGVHAREQYTVLGTRWSRSDTSFRVEGPDGSLKAFCPHKAFNPKEDIRLFTDQTCGTESFVITARKMIDFGVTHDVFVGNDGPLLGSYRRQRVSSTNAQDTWDLLSVDGKVIATMTEEPGMSTFLRRWADFAAFLAPRSYLLTRPGGKPVARFQAHFGPFVYRLGLSIAPGHSHPDLPDLLILAGGCLIAAIDGRSE
ncbi:MAG: hypothetical protein ACOYPS_09015 [Phycisphaerales bacterium]|jgi:hypothetical protein